MAVVVFCNDNFKEENKNEFNDFSQVPTLIVKKVINTKEEEANELV